MAELYRIDPDATTTHGTLAVVRLDKGKGYTHVGVLIPVEPCKCATSDDEFQDPRAWGDYPPLGSADITPT